MESVRNSISRWASWRTIGGGGLVDLARLDADEAVLDVVDPADAVPAGDLVQLLDQLDAVELAAVEGDGPAAVEGDLDLLGLVGGLRRVGGPLEGLGRRLDPGVFEDARLDRAAPEVLVGAEDRLLGRLDLDAVLGGVLQLLGPRPLPLADRGDDLQVGGEGLEGDVEPDLVVPLAGAAVGDGDRAVLAWPRGPSAARSGGGPSAVASGYLPS